MYSAFLSDPSLPDLRAAMTTADCVANYRARRRTRHWPHDLAGRIVATPSGTWEADGGEVYPCYTRRYSARTSLLGAAWWTDRSGSKHARIVGERACLYTSGRAPSLFRDASPWAAVFPQRAARRIRFHHAECLRLVLRMGIVEDRDRANVARLLVACRGVEGLLLVDRFYRPRVCVAAVACPSTGQVHFLGVPIRFGNAAAATYRRLADDDARVHAAIAWTFGLRPHEYSPMVEA